MNVHTVTALRALLDALLPRACAICGEICDRPPPAGHDCLPLCLDCESRLTPLAGRRCPRCGDLLISEDGQCMRCRGKDRAFDEAWPLFRFSGEFRHLLNAYKFLDRRSLASFFAELVAREVEGRWQGWPIVPVPPRPGKFRERGWDQVEDLARALGRRGFPVARVLERRCSSEQKKLGREERGMNARAAYRLKDNTALPKCALLLDDIMTTGATADACAAALKDGGTERVALIALAID